jgi:hypothetical protein
VIILGIVLLVLGYLLAIHLLVVLGIVALVVGCVLALAGALGHGVGGRRWYW